MANKRYTVLAVDDEKENLTLLARILQDRHRVLLARDGASALDLLKKHDVHMILADQRMPGMTGVELLEEARARHPDSVRLLITAYPDMDVAVGAINRGGVRGWISKPYTPEEVQAIVDRELEFFELARTNRRLAEDLQGAVASLLDANRELKELDRTKDYFLANVSHELKTPLVSGLGYLDLIRTGGLGPVPPRLAKGIEVAHRNLGRLLHLINDLLSLARMRYRPDAIEKSKFDLKALVVECVESLKGRARKRSLHVGVSIPRGLPRVEGDERRIHGVLTNVLSNAEKFTPDRARLSIRVTRRGRDRAEVRIRDNGIGLGRAKAARSFPFFKHADDPMVKKFGGLGIGLTLAREILKAHGCGIELTGGARGATVTFQLPLETP
ncbi:MAG TPA: hybrid sensor histidine kinase/response regulator [Candidatus Eisenbacteria bacterium]|nr:hybrid sensor histidine kinase/response regulator [Candidatus Eisenbacteria bacterium]